MNSEKTIQQLIEELKPEEYADFVNCLKENYRGFNDRKYYLMLNDILNEPENKAYFNTLSKGCQLAMLMFVTGYDYDKMLKQQVNQWIKDILSD